MKKFFKKKSIRNDTQTSVSLKADLLNNYRQIESFTSLVNYLSPVIPLPPMCGSVISPDFANLLISEIIENKPNVIFECGGGVSTIISSYCLQKLGQGHIYSIDHEEGYAGITRKNLCKHGLENYATVTYAPLKNYEIKGRFYPWYDLESLKDVKKIDMLVIDGPVGNIDLNARYPALPLLLDRLSDDAIILLDDAGRAGEKKVVKEWLAEYKSFHYEWYDFEKGAVILRNGNSKKCPCCKEHFFSFIPLSKRWRNIKEINGKKYYISSFDEGTCAEQWECPYCKSNPRTRMYYLYLEDKLRNIKGDIKLLHVAPEKQISNWLFPMGEVEYITMDLNRKDVSDLCDIRAMDIYKDQSFDIFICSHVLEHLQEGDQQALNELYRVTKIGGWGIFSVPVLNDLDQTFEDPSLNTEEAREKAYGEATHFRMYSCNGLVEIAEKAGFKVSQIRGYDLCEDKKIVRYGFSKVCSFFLFERI